MTAHGTQVHIDRVLRKKETTPMFHRAKQVALLTTCLVAFVAALATPAQASIGLREFDATFTNADGSPATQAGSHPYAATSTFELNTIGIPANTDEDLKDLIVQQIPGLVGNETAVPQCSLLEFATFATEEGGEENAFPASCKPETVVGQVATPINTPVFLPIVPVFNLTPPLGRWPASALLSLAFM